MLKLDKRIVELPEVKLALYETHLGRDTRLICIHGGPGLDHSSLLPGLSKLSETFDLTLLDLRGHGHSSEPVNENFSLDSYAGDLKQISAQYRDQKLGLFGHSFGGSVVLRTLANFSDMFDFGILCNSPIDNEYQRTSGAAVDEYVTDRSKEEVYENFRTKRDEDASYRTLMMDLGQMYFPEWTRPTIEELMGSWIYRVKPYNWAVKETFPNLSSITDCSKISLPMLVIGTRQDKLIPWPHILRFEEALKKSTLIQLEGGHFPFASDPKNFCKQIFQWWKRQRKE